MKKPKKSKQLESAYLKAVEDLVVRLEERVKILEEAINRVVSRECLRDIPSITILQKAIRKSRRK